MARRLARDDAARNRRHEIVSLPLRIRSVGDAVGAAADLAGIATDESAASSAERDARERAQAVRLDRRDHARELIAGHRGLLPGGGLPLAGQVATDTAEGLGHFRGGARLRTEKQALRPGQWQRHNNNPRGLLPSATI